MDITKRKQSDIVNAIAFWRINLETSLCAVSANTNIAEVRQQYHAFRFVKIVSGSIAYVLSFINKNYLLYKKKQINKKKI